MEQPKDKRTKAYKIWKALQENNIGDAISEVTSAMGIEECEGCNKRKELLNFGDKKKDAPKITEGEWEVLNSFYISGRLRFHTRQMYSDFRNINNKYYPKYGVKPTNCNKCKQRLVDRLRKLWEANKEHYGTIRG